MTLEAEQAAAISRKAAQRKARPQAGNRIGKVLVT